MSLRDDLIAAKALIDTPEKWGKGAYVDGRGCLCAYGAVMLAQGIDPDALGAGDKAMPADWALVHALPLERKSSAAGDLADVTFFNDDPTTTHADIMALFDRAIEATSWAEIKCATTEDIDRWYDAAMNAHRASKSADLWPFPPCNTCSWWQAWDAHGTGPIAPRGQCNNTDAIPGPLVGDCGCKRHSALAGGGLT